MRRRQNLPVGHAGEGCLRMYERYWSLAERPFQRTLDRAWFVSGPTADEALSRLLFLVEESRRCGLLVGAAGTGKTCLLAMLQDRARRIGRRVVGLNCAGLDRDELLGQLTDALSLPAAGTDGTGQLWRMLQQDLEGRALTGPPLVLLLDQFDQASPGCELIVTRLLSLAESLSAPLCIIAAARQTQIANPAARLEEISELRIELGPWSPAECSEYIQETLRKAGASRDVFTAPALFRVWVQSRGIPARVARLCDFALLAAMDHELSLVDCDVVDAAAIELGIAVPGTGDVQPLARRA